MAERYAIYYAPAATSTLWDRASTWLGRDAKTGEDFDGSVAGIERSRLLNFTATPARYGFHATLRAPFRLRPEFGEADLVAKCAELASLLAPVPLDGLKVGLVEGFLALTCEEQSQAVTDLAQAVVEGTEAMRAPLSEKELARRLRSPLSERHAELLDAYGYPYVAEQFLFHMTLSDRLDPEATPEIVRAAETWFAAALAEPSVLDRLVLYVEPDPERDFRRLDDFVLTGGPA
jgi:putative phosphonate metabolism protein